ncbi:unnamed protein product [Allacma fusca]|uniref:Uncharacterized protein n=1 Tax=Allacma fusca TaxID=39272 RepID=A0A8J2LM67_9HEXA|nr:unnamed protein product [Allacma fusca]
MTFLNKHVVPARTLWIITALHSQHSFHNKSFSRDSELYRKLIQTSSLPKDYRRKPWDFLTLDWTQPMLIFSEWKSEDSGSIEDAESEVQRPPPELGLLQFILSKVQAQLGSNFPMRKLIMRNIQN